MASYVNNSALRAEIVKSKIENKLTREALDMLLMMIDKIQTKFNYVDNDDLFDCRSHAVEVILSKWDKYDTKYENAFSYFTQMIKNALYAGWNKISKDRSNNHFPISEIFEDSI